MKRTLFAFLLGWSFLCLGQDCEELGKHKFKSYQDQDSLILLSLNFQLYLDCLDLNNYDKRFWSQGSQVVSLILVDTHIKNFAAFGKMMDTLKDNEQYQKSVRVNYQLDSISSYKISKNNHYKNKELLKDILALQVMDYKGFINYIEKNNLYGTSYKNAFNDYRKNLFTTNEYEIVDNNAIKRANASQSLQDITKESKKSKKLLILNFNGWGCVNSRKMEESLILTNQVQELIKKHFVAYSLYVDDRSPILFDTLHLKDFSEDNIKTTGNYWNAVEKEYFNTNHQPFYVICTPELEVIATQSYTSEKEEFLTFLKKGIDYKK